MPQLCHNLTVFPTESGSGFADLDHIPLATRRRLLLSSNKVHGVAQRTEEAESTPKIDIFMKREDDCSNFLGQCVSEYEHDVASETVVGKISESAGIGCSQYIGESGNLNACNDTPLGSNDAEDSSKMGKVEEYFGNDDLEHATLKDRRKMLLQRMTLTSAKPDIEGNFKKPSEACDKINFDRLKTALSSEYGNASFSGSQLSGSIEKLDSILCKGISRGSESEIQLSGTQERIDSIVKERPFSGSREGSLCGLSGVDYGYSPLDSNSDAVTAKKPRISAKDNDPPLNSSDIHGLTSRPYIQVKVEPLDGCFIQNVDGKIHGNFEQVLVKKEVDIPHENGLDCMKLSDRMNPATPAHVLVKREAEMTDEIDEEELDHMKLCDRLKLPASFHSPQNSGENFKFSSSSSEYIKPSRMLRPWKRKKTATDSIETALEEDAPGLLQVLLNQGVLLNELKLYGETDCVDDQNDSLIEESFSELEIVMSQLFLKRETCTKLLPLRYTKGSRSSYCLTCLFSLVEQARYLRFRKWPVEWGWCRDLQSFIFVFERHKRIVMERPEYGYATYFFELVDTSPVNWQIKRLMITMKLSSCGRNALIENKPLLVGEDITEGEAEVLMKYGWIPKTGLATMLNYRDRVFHDRKNEKENSEWRSKICNLLVDGYTNGSMVSNVIADQQTEADLIDSQVKLELC